uniref:tryptophan synthase n=1 Tax=Cajanus cajan TaxID=3821 RepID=A0A151T1F4_CAJCA|nr:hypothetical protein KK1_023273 [Cajanus cajan]
MATSIQFTGLNSSRVLPIPNPSLHFPSNMLKFAYLRTPSPSSVSCSVTRDPSSASSVVSLEEQAKTDNGSVLLQRPDSFGRFGKFGGKYVPETLMHALTELEAAFHSLTAPLELVRHIQYEQRMGPNSQMHVSPQGYNPGPNGMGFVMHDPYQRVGTSQEGSLIRQGTYVPTGISNQAMMALRQQMDHSNHDMVNLLSTQMHNIMTPLYELINKIGDKLDQMVERILNRHGFDVGQNERPYFVSAFPDYITQVELPRGIKVPKFSKFAGELTESTVEHIARYGVECGDLTNNEYLKMKYFPSSLTKHAFTWFTTLTPNSIHTWVQLEAVHSGTATLKDATSEAIRDWVTNVETTHYILGSVAGPHPYPMMVREFHAVIGKETRKQALEKWGGKPDILIACIGGGSNAMGIFHEFVDDKDVRLIGVEAAGFGVDSGKHAATLTKGEVGVLHGAMSYLLQDEDGQIVEPHSISAGLDYPGVGPEHSFLKDLGRAEYHSITDGEALEAFKRVSRLEGIIPALETSHALAYLEKICPTLPNGTKVVVNFSGRGDKDVQTAIKYLKV